MKAVFESVKKTGLSSFRSYLHEVPRFDFKWHFHPEYEITFIRRGKGNRHVGDSLEPFQEGDLVLIGANIPHTWVSDMEEENCQADVVQFSELVVSPLLVGLNEFEKVKILLRKSDRGICFKVNGEEDFLMSKFDTLHKAVGMSKVLLLFELLDMLASKTSFYSLLNTDFKSQLGKKETDRMDTVFNYIQDHFREQITLEKMSSLSCLTPTSFSRFFKKQTHQTFVDYLNELRLTAAMRELQGTDKSISEVAFSSGFNTLMHFNRLFKRKYSCSPSVWRGRNKN
ncbi:AraC family transcriptional regulator [uncultured Arcticibacterium sp.]|uniref:AraC family transcriptional regulator n=1 Tax=uncultured Arcticibacterium sp. TaxID=2173042 RepID=UPI0030F52813